MDATPQSKKSHRAAIRAARTALSSARRSELADQLAHRADAYLAKSTGVARKVAAYYSGPGEPDTRPLLQLLFAQGYEVYLPVCEPDFGLSWTPWSPEVRMERSTLAPVLEPVGPRLDVNLFQEVAVLFIPALAVDGNGLRLGQGGGYYDRFLPQLADAPVRVAALVYAEEFLPSGSITADPHDIPVDLVITPQAVHQIP